jgi:hypothetical protein
MIWESRGYITGVLAVIGLALLLAGCGGSSNETAAEQLPHLTKAELLKKSQPICHHGNNVINAKFNRWGTKNAEEGKTATKAELDAFTAKVVLPVRRTELRRLRALGIPHPGAGTYRRILAAMEEGIERGEQDQSSMRAVGEDFAFAKALEISFDYGLKSCWLE